MAAISLLLQAQVLGAFVCLELVLTAYSPIVGWIGIGVTSMLALVALALWVLQVMNRNPVAWVCEVTERRSKLGVDRYPSTRSFVAGRRL